MTTSQLAAGCAVVLVDPRTAALPAAALPALRHAKEIYAAGLSPAERAELGAVECPPDLLELAAGTPVVLLCARESEPLAIALAMSGAPVIRFEHHALLDAVDVMDTLRSPGGCVWDIEQTHVSLRQYLIEETYELLEAIEDGDRAALREELGDVLLQVLFHARIAAEHPEAPFTIDEVAADLTHKLRTRHPHVFAEEGDPAVTDAVSQEKRWDELKKAEKQRESSVDGVAMGQPAIALAGKLAGRAAKAGFPVDLLPDGDTAGETLFAVAALARLAGEEPENELRAVARGFAERIRAAETRARAEGLDASSLSVDQWRVFWHTEDQ
ncbi:nucleoside triphosphate pyrophosphohydrolase [Pseudonocardiaceae bacterium YIM PH 21723]|nr:nucleoside triphosphate pyrophosphohydrolase [Pseudonocardiaceae bacterium YIM PH 21723]